MGPNRHNKRKQKKGIWAPFHKEKFRAKMKAQLQEINSDW